MKSSVLQANKAALDGQIRGRSQKEERRLIGKNKIMASKAFPLIGNKIMAIGKNYQDHVFEMGGKVAPSVPVMFLKPHSR